MKDPFYHLYDIIYFAATNSNKKILQSYFPAFGENDPKKIIYTSPSNGENRFLYKYLLFHDQEPIFYENFKKDWDETIYFFNRGETNHILSNSEKNSKDKDQLLQKSGWHDFYWFSNGFMSLEWYRFYRYAAYLENSWKPTKKFSSYNRIFDGRHHRLHVSQFLYKNFPSDIILSCHFNEPNNQYEDLFINTINKKNQNLSFTIDTEDFTDSFCHITTERIFYEDRIHLTEKVFRPIICCRPFILVSSPKSLAYLKDYGFKTFSNYWSEEYDNMINHEERLAAILNLMHKIGSYSIKQMHEMLHEMKDILLFNRNHFYSNFRDIITKELYDNLDAASSLNNNHIGHLKTILHNLSKKELESIVNFPKYSDDEPTVLNVFLNAVKLEKSIDENQIRPFVQNNLIHFKNIYAEIRKLD